MPEQIRKKVTRKMHLEPGVTDPEHSRIEREIEGGPGDEDVAADVDAQDHSGETAWRSGRWEMRLVLPSDISEIKGKLYPLEVVAGVADGLRDLEERLGEIIRFARAEGHTWTEIGQALGVSKQAAWERFSGED